MKRWASLFILIGLLSLAIRATVWAAPNAQTCGDSVITSPPSGAVVFGQVEIRGSASIPDAEWYKVEVAPRGTEGWNVIGDIVNNTVINGRLAIWNTTTVPDGLYDLRLTVVDHTGNYPCRDQTVVRGVIVQNRRPTATPTVEETPIPEVTAAPPTAIPSVEVVAPTEPPPPTRQPFQIRTPAPSTTLPSLNLDIDFGGIFQSFLRTCLFGMAVTGGIFLLVGVIFFIRRRL
jgi:hypothetical protein